jgi:hypothetical protein
LGYQGDFALVGGRDPVDWFYAQHGPSIIKDSRTGSVTLGVFDNGNDRIVNTDGDMCGTEGQVACLSRATVFVLDERRKTATLSFHYDLPYLSGFGGNVEQLADSNLEFDAAASSATDATIGELSYSPHHNSYGNFKCSGSLPGVSNAKPVSWSPTVTSRN